MSLLANSVEGRCAPFEALVDALGDFGSTELGAAALDVADKKTRRRKPKADVAQSDDAIPIGEAVKRQTEEELADAPERLSEPFSETLRKANAAGDEMAKAPPPFN